jgi:hypothetical protein
MEYREFVVPSDAEMLDTLGVSPEPVEDDPTVRSFRLASATGDDVRMSYDVPGRSFRVQVSSGNVMRLDLLRESATRLSVGADGGDFRVRVVVESADLAGELDVSVGSEVVVRDRLLMS